MLLGSAGAAMGASALSTATNSAEVQYGSTTVQPVNLGQSAANNSQPPGAAPSAGQSAPDEVLPSSSGVQSDESGGETAAAQAPRQVAAQEQRSELPFTGYAAIPILLIGLLLLGSGLLLRRRNSPQALRP